MIKNIISKNDQDSKKIGVINPAVFLIVLILLPHIISVCAASEGTFDPPHDDFGWDTNGNSLYDYLVVNVTINVTSPGDFFMTGDLYDNFGLTSITYTWNYTTLFAGKNVVSMWFSGYEIYNSGENGPYRVELTLSSDSGSDTDTYYTNFYQYTKFEPPDAQFSPPHSDYGLDTNSPANGLFNYLVVKVNVSVIASGIYDVFATLMKSLHYIDDDSNSTYLDVGTHSVELRFHGPTIFNYGEDGPYDIELTLRDESYNELDSNLHITKSYQYTQFDQPPVQFSQPHDDYGIDTDIPSNDLYDFLVVNVHIYITLQGTYEVVGVLLNCYDNYIGDATNTTYLDLGSQIVKLTFDGTLIYTNDVDGPYNVLLSTYDDAYNELDSDTHGTNSYSCTDFDPPPAVFSPPYSDYGLDTDSPSNGLFNYLVVNVDISVTGAGVYEVGSSLVDDNYNFIDFDFNKTYLDLGIQTMEIRFYGPAIYENGWDGNFRVFLFLSDVDSNGLDDDIQYTNFYSWVDFDLPPAALSQPYFDFGLDTDIPANGLFDGLVLNVNMSVYEAGNYSLMAILYDDSQTIMLVASSNSTFLDIGDRFMQLYFDGWVIGLLGIDGPYLVKIKLLDGDMNLITMEDYYTYSYYSSDFESFLPAILSGWAQSKPVIDGIFSPGEWGDAVCVDLSSISGNMVHSSILVKNDAENLYICYDVIGDDTQDFDDMASVAFDTNNDNLQTDKREHQFKVGAWVNDKRHYIYKDDDWGWSVEDSPYDNSLPNHANLCASCGFGASDKSTANHRIYELCIPLALIGSALGGTIGFASYSYGGPGIADDLMGSSSWPAFFGDMPLMEVYGDLILASSPQGNVAPILSDASVAPSSGIADSTYFTYTCVYRDANGDLAQSPQIWINKSGLPIGGPFALVLEDWLGEPGNYVSGVIYSYSTKLSEYGTDYSFVFEVSDGLVDVFSDDLSGPVVLLPPNPPINLGVQGFMMNTLGSLNITDHDPVLNWTFSDPQGFPQAGYNITVWSGSGGTGTLMWRYNQTGISSSVIYDYDGFGAPLLDGTDYFLRIKTKDSDGLWGDWSEMRFHMNSPPQTPVNNAPSNGAFIPSSPSQIVQWNAVVDNEGSVVTYYWFIALDSSFSALHKSGFTMDSISGEFATQTGNTYHWRVRAYDGYEFGSNSTTWSFSINNPPNCPQNLGVQGFGINTPGSLNITDHTPKLNWTFSDIDGDFQGSYNITIWSGPQGTGTLLWWDSQASSDFSVNYDYDGSALPLINGVDYYLRIQTKDSEGLWGDWAEMKFHMNAPPLPPSLGSPANGAFDLECVFQELNWYTVTDPEKGTITYEWQVSKSPSFSNIVAQGSVSQHTASFTTVSSTKYYWRVRTYDGYERSGYSACWNFSTAPEKGSIEGKTIDENDDPLQGVTVELHDASGNMLVFTNTDDSGAFIFENVTPKSGYYLNVSKIGYEIFVSDAFDVYEDQLISLSDIVLVTKKGSIIGTVRDKKGEPLENAKVELLDHEDNIVNIQFTDTEGNFEFNDIEHGTYRIVISKDGYGIYTSDEFSITPGEQKTVSDIEITKKDLNAGFPWLAVVIITIAVLVLVSMMLFILRTKKQ